MEQCNRYFSSHVYVHKQQHRATSHFQNDVLGCNAVSWAPAQAIGSLSPEGVAIRRLVTGACDNSTRIWRCNERDGSWKEEVIKGVGHTGNCILCINAVVLLVFKSLCFCCSHFQESFFFMIHLLRTIICHYRLGTRRCVGSQHSSAVQYHC